MNDQEIQDKILSIAEIIVNNIVLEGKEYHLPIHYTQKICEILGENIHHIDIDIIVDFIYGYEEEFKIFGIAKDVGGNCKLSYHNKSLLLGVSAYE